MAAERQLPVLPALEALFPGGGLRRGSVVAVSRGASLALALAAGPSAAGSWTAAVGLPDLGVLAAAELGIAVERLVLVPRPDEQWATVVAALLDGIEVVLAQPPAHLRAGHARRLASRARERGGVLVAVGGAWPEGADVRLTALTVGADGLGRGDGRLAARQVEVIASGRGAAARERRLRLWLPDRDGTIHADGDGAPIRPAMSDERRAMSTA